MAAKLAVFKCGLCGHMVELTHEGLGTLVCCNQPMAAVTENTTEAAQEKHVPVIERTESGVCVTVGSVEHPMADDHYIELIEVIADGRTSTKYLKPGEAPKACFCLKAEELSARAYCNLHGLWKA
jgi:superoxide reductase